MVDRARQIDGAAELAGAGGGGRLDRLTGVHSQPLAYCRDVNVLWSKVLRIEAYLEVNLNFTKVITE